MDKILIIEDDYSSRDNINTIMEEANYDTITAANGTEGVKLAKKHLPDIIVCDITMPELDGFGVFSELNTFQKTKNIPFIFLTAKAELSDFRKGMNLGVDDYLTKPFEVSQLLKVVNMRLEKKKRIEKVRSQNSEDSEDNTKSTMELNDTVFFPTFKDYKSLKIGSIDFIVADGAYSKVYSSGKHFIIRKLLKEWEAILPSNSFKRVHRSTIINIASVEKIEKWSHNTLKINMTNYKNSIIASRKYSKIFRKNLII